MIVRARLKARGELAGMIGWHSRNLHYAKKLPELIDYLKPAPTPEGQREKGARDVKRMFDRMIKKQEAQNGDR